MKALAIALCLTGPTALFPTTGSAQTESNPIKVTVIKKEFTDNGEKTGMLDVLQIELPTGTVYLRLSPDPDRRTCNSAKSEIVAQWDEVVFSSCNHFTRGEAELAATAKILKLIEDFPACIQDARNVTVKLRSNRYLGAAVCKYH